MPNRILREGIRSSAAINALSDRAFRLYVNLLSSADDFGLMEWNFAWVKANAAPLLGWQAEEVDAAMRELSASTAVRTYEISGKTFAAVDKWDQRRNAKRPKFPMPPWGKEHIIGGYVAPRAREEQPKPEEKRSAKRVNGVAVLSLPEWLNAEQWAKWVAIRPARARKPETLNAALRKLEEWKAQGHDPNAIVQHSLMNGYQGLFEPKFGKPPQQNPLYAEPGKAVM